MDVLQDFDFDSFLHQDGGTEDNFTFDTSAFLDPDPGLESNPTQVQSANPTTSRMESSTQNETGMTMYSIQPPSTPLAPPMNFGYNLQDSPGMCLSKEPNSKLMSIRPKTQNHTCQKRQIE
jgi:hypothetical protein